MNILPKKKWHVRTKENIIRVRKDEAKAAEQEKRELERQIQAENERRMEILKKQADQRMSSMFGSYSRSDETTEGREVTDTQTKQHVNFFEDLEREERKNLGDGNQDYAKEKEKEKNEWEMKMGILQHLGQGTNELDKKKEWYETIPARPKELAKPEKMVYPLQPPVSSTERRRKEKKEKKKKRKHSRSHSSDEESDNERKKKKRKKSKRSSDSESEEERKNRKKKTMKGEKVRDLVDEEREKKERLSLLREQRLQRERDESARTRALLNPEIVKKEKEKEARNKPKYNSMFNPHLAR